MWEVYSPDYYRFLGILGSPRITPDHAGLPRITPDFLNYPGLPQISLGLSVGIPKSLTLGKRLKMAFVGRPTDGFTWKPLIGFSSETFKDGFCVKVFGWLPSKAPYRGFIANPTKRRNPQRVISGKPRHGLLPKSPITNAWEDTRCLLKEIMWRLY